MPEVNTFDERAEWRTCVSGNCVGNLERVAGNGRSSTLSGGKVLLDEPEPMLRQEVEEALADKNYRLARIVSTYRNETGNAEKENENWKRGLQEMSPLQIAQSAFEKIYQVEMPEELTDLFQEAYLAATRKEEEEE